MGVMNIFTDIIITGLAIYLVWDLNMVSKSKSLVITAFALRLFVVPVTIARLVTLKRVQYDDLSFSYSLPEVMTQLEMYCNLIATTLPCLRLFLTAWNTSFMDMRLEEIDNNAYRERKLLVTRLSTRLITGLHTNDLFRRINPLRPRRDKRLRRLSLLLQIRRIQPERQSCFPQCSCCLAAQQRGKIKIVR